MNGTAFWINRDFGLLWSGQAVSQLGDHLFTASLSVWIATDLAHNADWAPAAVAGVLVAASAPALLVGPVAGVFVDRWERRRTLIVSDLMRMVLVTVMVALAGGGAPVPVLLAGTYILLVAGTMVAQFSGPAQAAVIADLVGPANRAAASARNQLTSGLAAVAGRALGPLLIVALGAAWTLGANALSFLVAALAARAIAWRPAPTDRSGPVPASHFRREFQDGVRFVRHTPVLRSVVIIMVLTGAAGGAYSAVLFFFATGPLNATPIQYGVLNACYPAGAAITALFGARLVNRIGPCRALGPLLLAYGTALLVLSRLTSPGPAFPIMIWFGALFCLLNVVIGPLILDATPAELMGRAVAIVVPGYFAATLVGTVMAGALVSGPLRLLHLEAGPFVIGRYDSMFVVAGLLQIAGGLYALTRFRWNDAVTEPRAPAPRVGRSVSPRGVTVDARRARLSLNPTMCGGRRARPTQEGAVDLDDHGRPLLPPR